MLTRHRFALVVPLCLALTACDSNHPKARTMPDLADVKTNLAFTCAYEKDHIPERNPEADQLYKHARWMRKNNLLKVDESLYPKIERLIRIATAYGHDKANIELRDLIARGEALSKEPVKEILDLTDELMKRGIPSGFYDMGVYLERGYGVKEDKTLALKYYRKAADMGSPEAQYKVGDLLSPVGAAPEVSRQMLGCAAEQGHGKAGLELGSDFKLDQHYSEALSAYQLGAKSGNETAASFLKRGFNGPSTDDRLEYLGQHKDPERHRRYTAIWDMLSDYSYLNPKVPEIDKIVPLPPAKLPPWNGKFEWLEAHKANVPPPLPKEERIVEMAKAKGLDPATGRPLLKTK